MRSDESRPSLVVGVGASAGGLQAFRELLSALPADSGTVYLFVQHLSPDHESLLSELLGAHTEMPVREAVQDEPLCRDTVHVISPGSAMAVRDGRIELTEPTLHRGVRLPLDHLFRSLAREYGARAVGVVLSGAGSDGSAGLRAIKGSGGLTIAQEPTSSGQPGMPSSAIDTGLVDLVLEIAEMPAAIERFAKLPAGARIDPDAEANAGSVLQDAALESPKDDGVDDGEGGGKPSVATIPPDQLSSLRAMLSAQIDFDLSVYKSGTVLRRLLRRTLLSGFDEVGDYLDFLRDRPLEQQTLVRDLLISVTNFFRDPKAHQDLRELVVEPMIENLPRGGEVRVWVAGCATGEEAYSLGMTILDAAEERDKRVELQIFATDVDQEALAFARTGIYAQSIAEEVSSRHLERYFHPADGQGYRVRGVLRDSISFAHHDLTRDPPFSRMDIVSCRNVLIYLTPDAQRHVLRNLHFALKSDGHLVLSTSESPGAYPELFSTLSKPARLYRKMGHSLGAPPQRHDAGRRMRAERSKPTEPERRSVGTGMRRPPPDPARVAIMEAWVPPTVVVADDGRVLFMHGELTPYLAFPEGDDPRLTLDLLLRGEIATRVRGALYQCRRRGELLTTTFSPDDPRDARVRITARPLDGLSDDAVMLSFETLSDDPRDGDTRRAEGDGATRSESDENREVVEQLEFELRATREDLRSTVEELETSNEELRSSNEESMSVNEELQSANEELEATTEELRSLNEELTTVNGQLREKIEQLEQVNDDLGNFFASARLPMIFLDDSLRIKRFTPAAAELLSIDRGDIGRYTSDIARELLQTDLDEEARAVLELLETRMRELRTRDGRWFERRVLPYRTESRHIEGVVVTLIDVTRLRTATERLAARERQQSVIAQLGLDALTEEDLQHFVNRVVREVQITLDVDVCRLFELQPGAESLMLRASSDPRDGLPGAIVLANEPSLLAGYALADSTPVAFEHLPSETRFSNHPAFAEENLQSGLVCALRDENENSGVLCAFSRTRRAFSEEDADFLQAAVNIIGSTVTHYQSRLRARLEQSVSRTLVDQTEVDDMLDAVLSCLSTELDTTVGEIWWSMPEGFEQVECRLLHVTAGERRDEIQERICDRDVHQEHDLVARVRARGGAVSATDLGKPSLFGDDEGARSLGMRAGFGVPVRSAARMLGIMTLYSRERLFFNGEFMRSLERIGQMLGDRIVRVSQERRVQELAAITESSLDALYSHDLEGAIVEWLPGAERLFGYPANEVIGTSFERLVPESHREESRRVIGRILSGEKVEPYESLRVTADGREIPVSTRSSPVRGGDGRVIGISSTERDITSLKETERRLREADQQKDAYLAMLGHELRNPLSSIQTAAEYLRTGDSGGEEAQRLERIILRQSTHMSGLLDGLLDVSRIINNKITLDRHVVDFVEICRGVLDDANERIHAKELTLNARFEAGRTRVYGDRVRLVQIVDNLISNAIRYTPNGGRIDFALERDGASAKVSVRDTGVGITAELLPNVFEVFRQERRTLDRSEGGLGLGLSLVRSLVSLHDGTVEAFSDGPGKGAEFVVTLPLSQMAGNGQPVDVEGEQVPLSILVIEDNRDASEVTVQVLRRLGHTVDTAFDGPTGLQRAHALRPRVVLCDLGLPDGVTGFDVARRIREDGSLREIALIALSGYGRPEDLARSREAGFDHHLIKPIRIAALARVLGDVTAGSDGAD